MSFQSIPTDPPQPVGLDRYPVSALYRLYDFRSPEEYQSMRNEAPPIFDGTKRQKSWFDSTVDALNDPNGTAAYMVYRLNPSTHVWEYRMIAMPNSEAARVNIVSGGQPAGSPALLPVWEVPARALLSNEEMAPSPFGLEIVNTDMAQPSGPGFTDADRKMINNKLDQILSHLKFSLKK